MKKIYLFLIALFVFFSIKAQIPNGGFETWTNDSTPANWSGIININIYVANFELYTANRTSDAHSGTSAVVVASDQAIPYVNVLLPGVMSYGETYLVLSLIDLRLIISTKGGLPINFVPTKVKGFFKYNPVNNDTMGIFASCFYSTVEIGAGQFVCGTSQASYAPFEFPIEYSDNSLVPDTFNIIVASSASNAPQAGSAVYLDDIEIEFSGAGGPETIKLDDLLNVYPNPTTGLLYVNLVPNETNLINVYDYAGKQVSSVKCEKAYTSLDMRSYQNGAYVVEVLNSEGRHMKKFILAR